MIKKTKITCLLNEYGQQLGFIVESKLDINSGEIEFEEVQHKYKLHADFLNEINLFERDIYQPVLRCKLEAGQMSILDERYIGYLLFALAYFIFLSNEEYTFVQLAKT